MGMSANEKATVMIKRGGAGQHLATLPASTATTGLKLSTALQIICPLTTSLSKLAVLCLLHRILGGSSRPTRLAIRVVFSLVATIMLVQLLIPLLNCRPLSKTWTPGGPGTCAIPGLALWRFLGIPNLVTSILIIAIPLPAMCRLHVSRATRCGLGFVLGVCVLGIGAAIMRFWTFLSVRDFHDITYESVGPLCWTIAESGIYLVAGVLPTLRPLLKLVFTGTWVEKMVREKSRQSGSWAYGRRRLRGNHSTPAASETQRSQSHNVAEGVVLKINSVKSLAIDERW
jgi:hypothetical protein